eukprot:513540_1
MADCKHEENEETKENIDMDKNNVKKLEDSNTQQMIMLVDDICRANDKLISQKHVFVSYFQDNDIDGNKFKNLQRKTFSESVISYFDNTKLRGPSMVLFKALNEYLINQSHNESTIPAYSYSTLFNPLQLEEENEDADEVNDGYQYVKLENELLASYQKRVKQNDREVYHVQQLKTIKTKDMDIIQKCTGQIAISYDNNDKYRYGTGTIYKHLEGKYYLIITCAHNLTYFDDETNKKKKAKKIFYLPNGMMDQKTRLKCIHWIAHEHYNPNISHCSNDIGIILCYDGLKYYKKQKVQVDKFIHIEACKDVLLKYCSIFGYPIKMKGQLMGQIGRVKQDEHNKDKWIYTDIYTYPGQSGSVIYKDSDNGEIHNIYGIHIFGDTDKLYNRGVKINDNKIKWIKNKENKMIAQ